MSKYTNPLIPSKKPNKTYNMTAGQLDELSRNSYADGMKAAVPIVNAMCMASMLLALNSHRGFGKVRLADTFNTVQKYFDELANGEIEYADILQALKDDADVSLIVDNDGQEKDVIEIFRSIDKQKLKLR